MNKNALCIFGIYFSKARFLARETTGMEVIWRGKKRNFCQNDSISQYVRSFAWKMGNIWFVCSNYMKTFIQIDKVSAKQSQSRKILYNVSFTRWTCVYFNVWTFTDPNSPDQRKLCMTDEKFMKVVREKNFVVNHSSSHIFHRLTIRVSWLFIHTVRCELPPYNTIWLYHKNTWFSFASLHITSLESMASAKWQYYNPTTAVAET